MPRSLADGHEKIAILTTKPADPSDPTLVELNAGIDAACAVLASDWSFGAADSETFTETAVCEDTNASSYGRSNFVAGATVFRYFDSVSGEADAIADAVFSALKVKGTIVWIYARRTGKDSTDAWAAGDEIRLGAEVLLDTPQPPSDAGGYIKYRAPMQVQKGYPFIEVASA